MDCLFALFPKSDQFTDAEVFLEWHVFLCHGFFALGLMGTNPGKKRGALREVDLVSRPNNSNNKQQTINNR